MQHQQQTQSAAADAMRRKAHRTAAGAAAPVAARCRLLAAWCATAVLAIVEPCQAHGVATHSDTPTPIAAFIYNVALFTAWPDTAFADEQSPMVLCIAGKSLFGDALAFFADKRVHGRRMSVVETNAHSDLRKCHIAYFVADDGNQAPQPPRQIAAQNVLTIGETDAFLRNGGHIALSHIANKTVFRVNVEAIHRSGLHVSSKLLRLAETDEKSP